MKKWSFILLILAVIVACSNDNKTKSTASITESSNTLENEEDIPPADEPTGASDQATDESNEDELSPEEVKSIIESGFNLTSRDTDSIKKVNFHGDAIPEFVTILRDAEKDLITVYEYDLQNRTWIPVYEDHSHENYGGMEKLNFLEMANMLDDKKKEQVVIGLNSGSGAFLSFYVLGETESGIGEVLTKWDGDYPQGSIAFKDGALIVRSNGEEVDRFSQLYDQGQVASSKEKNLHSSDTASILINEFYSAIVRRDYEIAYALIGEPWRNKMSYESFSSGYQDTTSIHFSIDHVLEQSKNEMLVKGTIKAVNEGEENPKTFEVQYLVGLQEGELKIKEGKGQEVTNQSGNDVSVQSPNPEEKWTFEQWEAATFNEKVIKIARTWEKHVYRDPSVAKADTVLVSTALYIEDNYTSLQQSVDSIEELIIQSYEAPDVSSYDPEEACLERME